MASNTKSNITMISKLLLLSITYFTINIAHANTCALKGSWQSNKAKSLASMNENGTVNEKQRAFLEGEFFGDLIITYTCTEYTYSYQKEEVSGPYQYRSNQIDSKTLAVKYSDEFYDEDIEQILIFEDDEHQCYSIDLGAHLNFREYFCKVN